MPQNKVADPTEAIISAATRLFAANATRQVTLKWVALEAGVSSETVSDRWPTTTDLLSDVLGRLTHDIREASPHGRLPFGTGHFEGAQQQAFEALAHIAIRASLDELAPATMISTYPYVERLIDQYESDGLDRRTAQYRVYGMLLIEFSHCILGAELRRACGLTDDREDGPRAQLDALEALLASPPPALADR